MEGIISATPKTPLQKNEQKEWHYLNHQKSSQTPKDIYFLNHFKISAAMGII
jgi:sRNA-binding regulator protein Hfq